MGLQDRDYFWEDRKRREQQFKRDTYYRPKEFRKANKEKPATSPGGWKKQPGESKKKWMLLFAFFSGSFVTFWAVMIILQVNPGWLNEPYDMMQKLLLFMKNLRL